MSEPHAITRARERYGIELKPTDLNDLAQRCQAGEGRTATVKQGITQHVLIVGEQVLWMLYAVYRGAGPRWGTIITIMPRSVGAKQAKNDHKRMKERKREWRRWGRR